jgi:hypothetical protein
MAGTKVGIGTTTATDGIGRAGSKIFKRSAAVERRRRFHVR